MSDYLSMAQWGNPQPVDYGLVPSIARPEGLQMPGTGPGLSLVPGVTAPAASAPTPGGGGLFSNFLSSTDANGVTTQGWGMPVLGVAQGLMNGWLGFKQYQLAKDSLAENKRQFAMNYDAQRRTTNAALADRQAARVASNPGAYQSVGDYMKQNGIR